MLGVVCWCSTCSSGFFLPPPPPPRFFLLLLLFFSFSSSVWFGLKSKVFLASHVTVRMIMCVHCWLVSRCRRNSTVFSDWGIGILLVFLDFLLLTLLCPPPPPPPTHTPLLCLCVRAYASAFSCGYLPHTFWSDL